jgi:hypothetical protein
MPIVGSRVQIFVLCPRRFMDNDKLWSFKELGENEEGPLRAGFV